MSSKQVIVFDVGGVLLDWDPRHLYRKIFDGDDTAMEQFLGTVCTPAWNAQLDAGRAFSDAVNELVKQYPSYELLIRSYRSRWVEMITGAIEANVATLEKLHKTGMPLFALSNWSAETFPLMHSRYSFFDHFQDIILSGEVGFAKPDPRIYHLFLDRIKRSAPECLFIDDSFENIVAADRLGFQTIHYRSTDQLRATLFERGLFSETV